MAAVNEYNISIYDGNPRTFAQVIASGSDPTPFALYDSDGEFTASAPKTAKYCAIKLGYPIVDIELQDLNFFACFEDATSVYGSEVNSYNIRNNLLDLQGMPVPTASISQKDVVSSMGRIIQVSKNYGNEALSGGNIDLKKGYITTTTGEQDYDLQELWADANEASQSIEIKKVYHYAPAAKMRYYDPYSGFGSGTMELMQQFGWGNMSPKVQFVMAPIYADLLRMQAIEFNQMIRKSSFSFGIHNNKLRVYPVPTDAQKVWFEYIVIADRDKITISKSGMISDYSNVPYNDITYSSINDVGHTWIKHYTATLAKEMLGNVRSKYLSLPIPDGEVTLDGETLRSEAQDEKEKLIVQLRETLDEMSKSKMMERKKEESEYMQEVIKHVPLKIYCR